MAQKTLFFVQPYLMRKQKLQAEGARTFINDGEALRVGADMARRRAGVVVMAQSYDTDRQILCRPEVLRIHGHVPDEWMRNRQGDLLDRQAA
ncbi:hypothetical protein P7D22_10810 [Lichenihabitans sp. Uapishka_5]|uniref:hypothetical protein n=1 Tax=Lichenihabitans sp. Uapishka_5 TaxID=3037302 RepID=UPI0029E81F73|nr:hypothetical protein [Lichenihabitans sp. Uapishka_5]MDX7951658.1 hypothetical protein [Lichenihabitans sp. Uapishka_5]